MINPYEQQFRMEQALNQQKIDAETSMNAPMVHEQAQMASAALVEQIDPNKILEDIELKLKGLERTWDGKIIKRGEPLMNNGGINRIRTILGSIVNQNTIFSALDDREIGKLTLQISNDLIDSLTLNWKEWGIKNKDFLDDICNICLIPSFIALKRALQGGERRFIGTTTMETINTAPRIPVKQKEGFFSRFKL